MQIQKMLIVYLYLIIFCFAASSVVAEELKRIVIKEDFRVNDTSEWDNNANPRIKVLNKQTKFINLIIKFVSIGFFK